jgi:hypothetical protein
MGWGGNPSSSRVSFADRPMSSSVSSKVPSRSNSTARTSVMKWPDNPVFPFSRRPRLSLLTSARACRDPRHSQQILWYSNHSHQERASNNFPFFPPIPNGCPFTILWGFVACQLPGSPSCLSPGTAASLFRWWSIGPNRKFERKARGLRKATEKKRISQPRMKHGWNTDKKQGQLPQLINLVILRGS